MENKELGVCSWCGGAVKDFIFATSVSPLTWGNGSVEVEVVGGFEAVFCCMGCEWNFELSNHLLLGMDGKTARRHLVDMHELEPSRPAGSESDACFERRQARARAIARIFGGLVPENLN
jgi:hypothetical protein